MNFPAADGRFISRRIDETSSFSLETVFLSRKVTSAPFLLMLLLSMATLILPSEMVPILVQLPPPLDVVVVSQALNIKAANTVAAREKTFDIHKTSLFTESQPILSVKMAYIVNQFCKVEPLKRIL